MRMHLATVIAVALGGCAGPDSLSKPVSTRAMLLVDGDHQIAVVGQSVAHHPTIQIINETGVGLEGIAVTFAVVTGGGKLSISQGVTGTNGFATTSWELGHTPGENTIIVVTNTGVLSQQTFTATAVVGPPADIAQVQGDGQVGMTGSRLAVPLKVVVTDVFGNVIAGVPLVSTVVRGGGTLIPAQSVLTGEDGIATLPGWELGVVGLNQLQVTIGAYPALVQTFSATGSASATLVPVTVNVQTTGSEIDPDGFVLALPGYSDVRVAANGATNLTGVPAGTYAAPRLIDVSSNCDFDVLTPAETVTLNGEQVIRIQAAPAVTLTYRAHCAARLPGGDRILFQSSLGISTVRPDGTDLQRVIGPVGGIDWSVAGDGSRTAWTQYGGNTSELWTSLIDGTAIRKIPVAAAIAQHPSLSPDGRQIAFDDGASVRVINVDGTGESVVGAGKEASFGSDGILTWLQNGKTAIAPVGGAPLTLLSPAGDMPRRSPDGRVIALMQQNGYGFLNTQTGVVSSIPQFPGSVGGGSWSPDSRQFTFAANYTIYVVNADGTNLHQLLVQSGTDSWPIWIQRP